MQLSKHFDFMILVKMFIRPGSLAASGIEMMRP